MSKFGEKAKTLFQKWRIFLLMLIICYVFGTTKALVRYQNIALIVLLTIMAAYTFLLEGKDVGSDMEEESDMVSED